MGWLLMMRRMTSFLKDEWDLRADLRDCLA